MASKAPLYDLPTENLPVAKPACVHLVVLGGMGVLGLILFWPSVYKVAYSVLHRHGSSHGIFIPILSAYFIYLKWDRLKALPVYFFLPGVAALPLLLFTPLVVPSSFELQFVAYLVFVVLAVLVSLGRQICRAVLFPILFMITMIPIPRDLYALIADMTRHVAFSAALGVLSILNIPFFRDGWNIKLPNALLEVAVSCSGIRYLISYFVFGIAYAYLFRSTALSRVLLVAATVPISLFASSLRLTIIFLATYLISPRMAEYWPHVILSWGVFFLVLFAIIGFDQYFLGKQYAGLEGSEQSRNI